MSEDPSFVDIDKENLQDPQSLNSYSYAENNPITKIDPDGKQALAIALYAAAPYIITGVEMAGTAAAGYFAAHDTGTILGTAMSGASQSYKNGVYDSIAQGWGNAASLEIGLPAIPSDGEPMTQLQMNKAKGSAFEDESLGQLNQNFPQVGAQVTLKTQSGIKVRPDFITQDSEGNYCLFECKSSSTASLTKNQSLAFPEIQQSGATIVGKGKPGFAGGTTIPPIGVTILRQQ